MSSTHVSRTAEFIALFRALETKSPARQRLFTDVFAQEFLRPPLRLLAKAARFYPLGMLIARVLDWQWPGARTSGIARTRFIDEVWQQELQDGFEQFVILGAGFDARAYRLPGMERVRVFEVDAPDTQLEKQQRLKGLLTNLPDHVSYVALDFTKRDLATALQAAGFDATQRTFFLWEGVTNYLNAEAVEAVFHFVSTIAPESHILFTYVHKDILEHPATFVDARSLKRLLRRVDEPWTFGFDPAELAPYMEQHGLRLLTDIDSVEYRTCYLKPSRRILRGYTFYRLALAAVRP